MIVYGLNAFSGGATRLNPSALRISRKLESRHLYGFSVLSYDVAVYNPQYVKIRRGSKISVAVGEVDQQIHVRLVLLKVLDDRNKGRSSSTGQCRNLLMRGDPLRLMDGVIRLHQVYRHLVQFSNCIHLGNTFSDVVSGHRP